MTYKSILNIIVSPEGTRRGADAIFLTGLLNSSLLSWYFDKVSNKPVTKTFPRISLLDLKTFPYPERASSERTLSAQLRDHVRDRLKRAQPNTAKGPDVQERSKSEIELLDLAMDQC